MNFNIVLLPFIVFVTICLIPLALTINIEFGSVDILSQYNTLSNNVKESLVLVNVITHSYCN